MTEQSRLGAVLLIEVMLPIAVSRPLKDAPRTYDGWISPRLPRGASLITPPPQPAPPRPDLASEAWPPLAPTPPRRFPSWVVGSAILTLVMMLGGVVTSLVVRYDPAEHRDEYRFIARDFDGGPVRWNPCEPVHYVVNVARAPTGSLGDVQEAVRRVSAATGITFMFDGITDEVLERRRELVQADRYGERWAPVLVTWEDPDTSDVSFRDEGDAASGVAAPLTPPGADVIVSGWIAINADDPNPPGFEAPDDQGPVVLHEWGHVMGLDHVKEHGELMHPAGGGVAGLGPGDLEGLRRLGRSQGCLVTPVP